MKVAFLSAYDPLSTSSWSGTPYYMLKALSKRNISIEILGPVNFPSKWAMDFCKDYYRLDSDKLVEIPWGANLFEDIHFANKTIIQKISYTCLFLGVDWERKGGKTAL
ncbi:TPA: glycosyltransferase, partial [Escherichia coli]